MRERIYLALYSGPPEAARRILITEDWNAIQAAVSAIVKPLDIEPEGEDLADEVGPVLVED